MILNLTQHPATREQREAGVFDLPPVERAELRALLTFTKLPSSEDVRERAAKLASLAKFRHTEDIDQRVLIGGAPFLMHPLCQALSERHMAPVFAFSQRESVEETLPDGSVVKRSIFRHQGFVPG